jgi:hypothetical protein
MEEITTRYFILKGESILITGKGGRRICRAVGTAISYISASMAL